MSSNVKGKENALNQNNISLKNEDKNIHIYFITSFNSKITSTFDLIAKNSEVSSIKSLLKTYMKYYYDYDLKVYEIVVSKKIKTLNLCLNKEKIFYDLNTITVKSTEQKIILFDDLIVVQNSISNLANQLDFKKTSYIFKHLNLGDKFNIFLKCFEEQGNKNELKILLASKILSILKKNSEIKFSVLISLFNIIFANKLIIKFLNIYPKLDIDFDELNQKNEEFDTKILKLYENETENFFKKNLKFLGNLQRESTVNNINNKEEPQNEERIKNLLENFVVLYKLFNEDAKNIEQQKLINVREILFNLIDNKNDLFKVLSFIILKFDIFSLLLSIGNDKRYTFKPYLAEYSPEIAYKNFYGIYDVLTKKSEKFLFDFSDVFNYFLDRLKNLEQLISLKKLYKRELSIFANEYFEVNIIKKIHKIGFKEMMTGIPNNSQILFYLRNDDVYCKKDCKIGEYKDFEILMKLKIELMDDSFFEKFNKFKIYSFFEENYEKYLSMFPSINNMKYFGLFFKLLPPELFNKQTTLAVFNWIMENLNTYNRLDCPNFKNEIKTFYFVLNKTSKYLLPKLIEKLIEFLGEDCIELFIFLINAFNQNVGPNESYLMINYIIFENQKEQIVKQIKLNNLYEFLKIVKPSKLIAKTFLNIIGEFSITCDDFLSENDNKFNLLDNILKLKEYSLKEEPENKNCQYWLNTMEESKKIYENLKNLNFVFTNIQIAFNIIKEKTLAKRASLIAKSLGKEDYELFSSSKINEIKKVLKNWSNNTKTIEKIKNIYKFINKPEKIINELYEYNLKIFNSTLQDLNSIENTNEFSEKCKNLEKVNKIYILKQCDVFMNIFYDTKKKISFRNSYDFIDLAIERFDKLKNIFVNDKSIIENELIKNEEAKFLINIDYKNENDLEKEINWLLNYFKLNGFGLKLELIDSIKLIIKKKFLFLAISGFLKLFNIYKDILYLSNSDDISLYEKMLNYESSLSPNMEITFEKIHEINNNIENIFELNESNSKIFFKLLMEINQNPDSIEFIKDKEFNQVEKLVQFLLESDDSNLTEKDINNFIGIVKFFEGTISDIKGNNDIFNKFLKRILNKIVEDIEFQKCFFNYIEKYNHIQRLFNNYLKNSEGSLIIIEKILKDSYFVLSKNGLFLSSSSYTMESFYKNQNLNINNNNTEQINNQIMQNDIKNQYNSIPYQEIEQLFQRVYISNIPKKFEDDVKLFIKFFKSSKKLMDLLDKFYLKGYPENFDIILIEIKDKIINCQYKNKNYGIESLINYFEEIYIQVNNTLNKWYASNEILRFFYGRQLFYIYNNIKNNNSKILEFLNASFGINLKKYSSEIADLYINQNNENYKYILYLIYRYIISQFEINKIFPNIIMKKNTIIRGKYNGIYFYVSTKNQEMEVLNLYISLTKNFPVNGCFLYCSKYISLEELHCFIFRFFYCRENIIFSIVNADLLDTKIKDGFISIIKNIALKYSDKIKSCLVITFRNGDMELHNFLMKTKNVKSFPHPILFESTFNFYDYFRYNDYVVKSSYCGFGKSEFIKKNILDIYTAKKKQKVNYIYFPIGGKFTKKSLFDRLLELPNMTNLNEKFVIHFDISQTKELQLLKEFFFKLIILRKCDMNESARFFGSNVDIIIEVPNDFMDYINNVEILSKLKIQNIEETTKLNLTPELINVAKILSLYENGKILNEKEVDLKDVELNLNQEEISNFIFKYLKDINVDKPNYYQFNIFIKVLSDEFIKFYNCSGYSVQTLANNGIASGIGEENTIKLIQLRKFIIYSLVQVTKLFLIGPYENLIKSQEINKKIMNENDDKKEKLINKELNIKIDSISFDSIKPSLIVFNEDGNSCTIITTCSERDPEFTNLERLYNSQNIEYLSYIINKRNKPNNEKINYNTLKAFRDLSGDEILDNLLNFLNVSGIEDEKKKEILGSYVYTPDNFIKVVLILMRIRVGIPIILMGETGCGKTTLIEMASKLINKGKICIYKMNIHAGIEDEDIINFMNDVENKVKEDDEIKINEKKNEFDSKSPKEQKLYLKKNPIKKIYETYENEVKKRKIWIFFDEINTCNSMGLFTEIMCKNSIYGKPLNNRFIYIAACNPYRVADENSKSNILNVLYKKNRKKKNLVYTVNPLPISLLNFVFNFGSLKEDDEFTYIESMVGKVANELFSQIKDNNILREKQNFLKNVTKCVKKCQNFMKKNNDVSIVSLREVNRYNIFFKFFYDYLIKRKNEKNNYDENDSIKFYNSKTELEILYFSVNLSLFICYYLRIVDKNSRAELCNSLNEERYFSDGNFLLIPQMEQNYLLDNFQIPVGIAKNKNLKENIFLLFFCIINKIPVIICGAPGKSKTLSFEILQDSMKGKSSKSDFCRMFPPLTAFKIQGSLNTTSEDILNIFKKGRTYQKENEDKLSVVFMDEMGLAEISENNPLKVIHSELEQENNKISFVGISNWFIDASKMNRVIYNVVQDNDEEDVIQTGKEIAKSYEKIEENFNSQEYDDLISRLSKAYYQFISNKREIRDIHQFFHGSRDFYSLIKSIMQDIIKNKNNLDNFSQKEDRDKLLNNICMNQIVRNFSGLENSVDEFNSYYLEEFEKIIYSKNKNYNYNFKKCIQDNINDKDSRYLLLINDGHLSQELFNYIIEEINDNRKHLNFENKDNDKIQLFSCNEKEENEVFVKYYIGSEFKGDKNNVLYSNEILNKIRIQMETENILILKDLELVYPALYELFNQNYIYLNGKKFVHLGESKSLSLVNDKFKVIVLIEKNKLESQEAPFLNRFEKHIINFSSLLNKELKDISNDIFKNIKEIFDFKNYISDKYKDIQSRFEKYELTIKEQDIQSLVYIGSKQLNLSKDPNSENETINRTKIINFVLERIVPCFSEELMVLIRKFFLKKKYNSFYENIFECYKNKYCYDFNDFLDKSKDEISIVYTFSSLYEDIAINKLNRLNYEIIQINASNIISIENFNKEIMDSFFEKISNKTNQKINLLIIRFKGKDLNKLNNIYYSIIDYKFNSRNKNFMKKKKFVFIVYLKNMKTILDKMSFLSNCSQILINNINNTYTKFSEILNKSNIDIIKQNYFDTYSMIENNIEDSLMYFNFKLYNCNETKTNSYRKLISKNISNSKYLKGIFIESFSNFVNNEEDFLIKIYQKKVSSEKINYKNNEFNEISNFSLLLDKYIQKLITENLRKIIKILESEQIINAIISNERMCQVNLIKNYINDFISNINNEENLKFNWTNMNLNNSVEINIIYDIKFPFCQKIVKNLYSFVQNNIASKFLEKETFFIITIIDEQNLKNEIDDYWKTINKLEDKLANEIYKNKKNKIVFDILNSNDEELISNFFEDCFYYFIQKNDKFKLNYKNLSQLLNLLVQLRLKSRINNELNINENTIELHKSFMDLIKREWNIDNDEKKEEDIYINDMKVNNNSIYYKIFISIIIFLQSYSNEIYIIMELYNFLLNNMPTLYDDIVSLIINKKISMENSKRNSYYNKINKYCFFYIIESICKILKERLFEELIVNRDSNLLIKYFMSVHYLGQNIFKLDRRFLLFSKEIFSLDIIMKIILQVQMGGSNNSLLYVAIEYLKIFFEKIDESDLIDNLKGQDLMLIKIFGNNLDKYSQLMNKIIFNYYRGINNNTLKEKLIQEVFLEDRVNYHEKLHEFSYPLLKFIFKFNSMDLSIKKEIKALFSDKNSIKKLINDKNNQKINEILFYRFEILVEKYFQNIINMNKGKKDLYRNLCGELSLIYLKEAIECYYKSINTNNIQIYNIYKLYCLAYIKVYIRYYMDILLDKKKYQQFVESEKVNEILFSMKIPQKQVLNYYLVKLISRRFHNWVDFADYYNSISTEDNDIFGFNKYQNILKIDKNECFIKSPFLLHCFKIRDNARYIMFKEKGEFDKKLFNDLFLDSKKFNYLYIFLANITILIYSYKNEKEYSEKQNNLIRLNNIIIKYLNEEKKVVDKDILNFFNEFFNQNYLSSKIFPKIGLLLKDSDEKKLKKIKILYYSLLFVFSILHSSKIKGNSVNNEFFYKNLISKNLISFLKENYIPGNFQFSNMKIRSYYYIKELLTKNPFKDGIYLCSCGFYYTIDKSTFPTEESECPVCHQKLGGKDYNLVKREGHIRVFLDNETRKEIMTALYSDKYVPSIILEDYEKDNKMKKKEMIKGIQIKDLVMQDFFSKDEKVREMNDITYRFMNFVLYSFIFYANVKELINNNQMKNYTFEILTCFDIIENNWQIMQAILDKIPVELFINLIFDDIIEKLISCPKFNTKEEAINFEKEINNIIIEKIKNKNLIDDFKRINLHSINLEEKSDKTIIQEIFPYNKYSETELPFLKYFYINEIPTREHFIKSFNLKENNKTKYPLINAIINNDDIRKKIKLMKYIPKINKVCNYMINYISYKYSRDEAKAKKVKDEIKDEDFISLLKEFIPIYQEIRPYIKHEDCNDLGSSYQTIDEDTVSLNDLCVDSGEKGFGLVLLGIYKEFSKWQNSFINEVINSDNVQLNNYKDLFNNKVMIQDCEEEQILDLPSFDDIITLKDDKPATLLEMILGYSHRTDNAIYYNYDEIEDELAEFILPKLRCFKQEFRKVVYQYECFIGERSSLIYQFLKQYKQRELTQIEFYAVLSYILKNQNNNKTNLKNFLFSLQVLIGIILEENPKFNETLYSILEREDKMRYKDIGLKVFKNISENIKKFENINEIKEKKRDIYLNVDCLLNLLEIVELFCWENIRNNLSKKYLDDIDDKIKSQFNTIFNIKKEAKNDALMINKNEFCSAIRKFISRYLSGRNEDSINPKNLLKSYITKNELWPSNLADNGIENDINKILGNLDIHISQSVKLYDYLGGDEEKLENIKNKYLQFEEKYINIKLNNNKNEQKDDTNTNLMKMNLDMNSDEISENNEIKELNESKDDNDSEGYVENEEVEY